MTRSVQVKTLKGESFRIDLAEEALISDVKAKISEDRGIDPATQVLICAGKTLKDEDDLSSSLGTSGFLVLMVKAKRRVTAPSAATTAAAAPAAVSSSSSSSSSPSSAVTPPTAPTPAVVNPPSAATATAASVETPAQSAAPPAAGATSAAGAGGGVPQELAIDPANVDMLTAMGFPEDQARAALRAAFNDVGRAATYLMEGIPEDAAGSGSAGMDVGQQGGGAANPGEGADLAAVMAGMAEGEGNPLNFMRFHPQFEQLRSLVRENPAMLPQVLQQLGSQSPELMERINDHPDDFLRLMNEPPDAEGQAMMDMGLEGLMEGMEQDDGDSQGAEEAVGVGGGEGGDGGGAGGGGGGQGQVVVELTTEEDAAVQNLMVMVPWVGRDQVIEAFIACDKNAEMAANLLFENAQ